MSEKVRVAAVGIYLGATYSCVAVWSDKHNHVEIIPNKQGKKYTPSCIGWDGAQLLVGHAATRNPKNAVFMSIFLVSKVLVDVKRLMGSIFSDGIVQKDIESSSPFKVIEGPEKKPMLVIEHESGNKKYSYAEVYSMILKILKEDAEAYLGTQVIHAVIAIPPYFDKQWQEITDAVTLAGLNVMKLISEPTSAAITYVLDKSPDLHHPIEKNVFVFDISGRTFNMSLLHMNKAGTINSVKNAGGDTHLGGEDFDKLMVNHCVQEFKKIENKDVTEDAKAMIRLEVAYEKAMRDLTSTTQTSIEINSLYDGIDFSITFSRENFEELNANLFKECIEHVKNCLRDGKMHKKDIADVVLVGDSTRIPKLQQMLMEFFDGKPVYKSINADEAVAYGAALLATRLSGNGNQIGLGHTQNSLKQLIKKTQIKFKKFVSLR
ncbi:heat shock cognate 70 kDa protein [Tanacetum coccineum]